MKTLDEHIAAAKTSKASAQVLDFQQRHDWETLKRFAALCARIRRTGSAKDVAELERWLWAEYDSVSQVQGTMT